MEDSVPSLKILLTTLLRWLSHGFLLDVQDHRSLTPLRLVKFRVWNSHNTTSY
jgi:hypothetical protein